MKEIYLKPAIEVVAFEGEDILAASVASLMAGEGVDTSNMMSVDVSDTSDWQDYTDTN